MMEINDLIVRLFKGNVKKYGIFIVCNVLAIGILISLRLLLDNPVMCNSSEVDPMISSNVYAPTFFMYVFIAFFIPYTLFILNRQIEKNYGILMSLGLTRQQLKKSVLTENGMVALASMVGGVVIGNILELFLCGCVKWIIANVNIKVCQNIDAYVETLGYIAIIYLLSIGIIWLKMRRKDIQQMLLEESESEEQQGNPILFVIGLFLSVLALALSCLFYEKTEGNILLVGMLVSFIGLILAIGNSQMILKVRRKRALFLYSDYLYYFKRNKRAAMILVALYSMILFFNIATFVIETSLRDNAKSYHPYDLCYSEDISTKEEVDMEMVVQNCGTEISYSSKIKYIYSGAYAVFGVNDVNKETGHHYEVLEGKFILVRSVVSNDGYFHEAGTIPGQMNIKGKSYDYYDDFDQLLFCRGAGLTDTIILLNQNDFDEIAMEEPDELNTLCLYGFLDWSKTEELSSEIEAITGSNVASLYDDNTRAEKSGNLLIFLMIYISLVFLCNVCITIHYQLLSEWEEDYHKYNLLQSLGATARILKKQQLEKNISIIVWPLMLAVIWMMMVSYTYTFSYDYQRIAFRIWLIASIVIILVMVIISIGYTKILYLDKK